MRGKPVAAEERITVRIWRGTDEGRFHAYEVPLRANQTVLDIVTEVQRRHEPALAYRFACRVGVCGSCAMTVNGVPRWTCRTHVRRVLEDGGETGARTITIEPLRNLPRIKDLVADMSPFFDKWTRAGGRFEGALTRADEPQAVDPGSRRRRAADAGIECINCGVCYAACDVVGWNPEYLGPAALNRAWTLYNDDRHADRSGLLEAVLADGGCQSCHTQGNCTRHCPVGISPTRATAGLKRASLWQALGFGRGRPEAKA
ncbi:MAG: 2Fe-2S iron-sulfur cluster-binding protein [Burkholderiaceae bacterium]